MPLLNALRDQFRYLASNAHVPLSRIDDNPSLKTAYESTRLAENMMYDSDDYNQFVSMIRDVVPEDVSMEDDTIGSYLVGCIRGRGGDPDIPAACTPSCSKAIASNNGMGRCLERVFTYRNGELTENSSDNTSTSAYLYAYDPISSDKINWMKDRWSLRDVKVVSASPNAVVPNARDNLANAVNRVRFNEGQVEVPAGVADAVNTVNGTTSSGMNWWVPLVIILIVGIILFLLWWKNKTNTVEIDREITPAAFAATYPTYANSCNL
uniref:Uncharacterized protein n=1 Tax=viral metagenome TaxID=1070528 RepID=A0A6C0BKD6_9ZZZZ